MCNSHQWYMASNQSETNGTIAKILLKTNIDTSKCIFSNVHIHKRNNLDKPIQIKCDQKELKCTLLNNEFLKHNYIM